MFSQQHKAIDQPLWAWFLRPQQLQDVIADQKSLQALQAYAPTSDMPNLIMVGPPGSNKSTLAHIVARNYLQHQLNPYKIKLSQRLKWMPLLCLEINGSLDRSKKIISENNQQGQLIPFIKTHIRLPIKKVVIIHQFDVMMDTVQMAMKRIIEQYENRVRFILIVDQLHKVAEAVQSRCLTISLTALTDAQVIQLLTKVIQEQNPCNLTALQEFLPKIATIVNGDAHSALNYLQLLNSQVCPQQCPLDNDIGQVYQLLQYICQQQMSQAHQHLSALLKSGYTNHDIVDLMIKIVINDYQQIIEEKLKAIIIATLTEYYYLNNYHHHAVHLHHIIDRIGRLVRSIEKKN